MQERVKIVLFPRISGVPHKSQIVSRRRSRIEEVLGDASNQILPDGCIIMIVGGRNAFSYEFFPKNFLNSTWPANYYLRFLRDTRDPREQSLNLLRLHTKPRGKRVSGDPGEDIMLSISVAVGSQEPSILTRPSFSFLISIASALLSTISVGPLFHLGLV